MVDYNDIKMCSYRVFAYCNTDNNNKENFLTSEKQYISKCIV